MAGLARRWPVLAVAFVVVFAVAAWYFAGVFATPPTPDPAGATEAAGGVDWGRVLGAAAVVALLATGILGVLIRLARPEDG
jgi:uncharacterized membrane protein